MKQLAVYTALFGALVSGVYGSIPKYSLLNPNKGDAAQKTIPSLEIRMQSSSNLIVQCNFLFDGVLYNPALYYLPQNRSYLVLTTKSITDSEMLGMDLGTVLCYSEKGSNNPKVSWKNEKLDSKYYFSSLVLPEDAFDGSFFVTYTSKNGPDSKEGSLEFTIEFRVNKLAAHMLLNRTDQMHEIFKRVKKK